MSTATDILPNVETWGAGPSVVMLHGGASSGAQWRRVAAVLQDRYRLIAPDLIGCGKTPPLPKEALADHDRQADLVAALIATTEGAPVTLVGHSLGGAVAVRVALQHPRLVSSLVLIEPILMVLLRDAGDALFAPYEAMATQFITLAERGDHGAAWATFIEYRQGPGAWAKMSHGAKERLMATTRAGVEALTANLKHPTRLNDCRHIGMPTTIICGGTTTPPDRRVTEVLRDAIPGAAYVMLEEAGHMSPLTHPESVAAAILEHLGRE